MKISKLEEMLKAAKERLGDVEVYAWDDSKTKNKPFAITTLNAEGDHIELT
jgi:hypothetical protein